MAGVTLYNNTTAGHYKKSTVNNKKEQNEENFYEKLDPETANRITKVKEELSRTNHYSQLQGPSREPEYSTIQQYDNLPGTSVSISTITPQFETDRPSRTTQKPLRWCLQRRCTPLALLIVVIVMLGVSLATGFITWKITKMASCQSDINRCASSPCQNGGTCTDKVNGYTCTCAADYTGVNCQTCIPRSLIGPAGSPVIPDSALSASSTYGTYHTPDRSRLNSTTTSHVGGAWSAANPQTGDWLQAVFDNVALICSIETQGRFDSTNTFHQWVTQYYVMYGNSTSTLAEYQEKEGRKVFSGNWDENTVVTNSFSPPITARYVRVIETAFQGWPSMRWDLLGCQR